MTSTTASASDMPEFLREFLEHLDSKQANALRDWLVLSWREKSPHYPVTEMVQAASSRVLVRPESLDTIKTFQDVIG